VSNLLEYIFEFNPSFSNSILRVKAMDSATHLLLIKKHTLTDFDDYKSSLSFWNYLLDISKQCIHPEDLHFLNELNVLDCLQLLIVLRCISCGNELKLIVYPDASNEETKININLFLDIISDNWFEKIKNKIEENEEKFLIKTEDFLLKINTPFNSRQPFIDFSSLSYDLSLNDYIKNYVEYIQIKNDKFLIKNFSKEETDEFFNKLPINIFNKIKKTVLEINQEINSCDFYQMPDFIKESIHFLNDSIPEVLKLIYSEKISNVLKEHYILSKKNIQNIYIEKISPIERQMFLSFIEQEYELREKINAEQNGENNAVDMFKGQEYIPHGF